MRKNDKKVSLSDADITSRRKITRRSLLASTGIGLAAGAAAIVALSAKEAQAGGDSKSVDTDVPPASSDPDKDW